MHHQWPINAAWGKGVASAIAATTGDKSGLFQGASNAVIIITAGFASGTEACSGGNCADAQTSVAEKSPYVTFNKARLVLTPALIL